jgi:hypothetical protein
MCAILITVVVGQAAIVALKSAVAAVIGDVALARVTLSWTRTVPLHDCSVGGDGNSAAVVSVAVNTGGNEPGVGAGSSSHPAAVNASSPSNNTELRLIVFLLVVVSRISVSG